MTQPKRKLIEVALPLEAINEAGRNEKNRKTGTIRNIHKWFAPMPGPVWRVLLAASLIDDPGDEAKRAELLAELTKLIPADGGMPTQEASALLARLLGKDGKDLLNTVVVDPFCGGGTTLLEAQRLGLNTVASDLNPVPTIITKVTTELLPLVREHFSQGEAKSYGESWKIQFEELVIKWSQVVGERAKEKLSPFYPPSTFGVPFAWLWAHSIPCPNPACGLVVPLYSSALISDQPGAQAWLKQHIQNNVVKFEVVNVESEASIPNKVSGSKALFACMACKTNFGGDYIKKNIKARTITPIATAYKNGSDRSYVGTFQDETTFNVKIPDLDLGHTPLPVGGLGISVQPYGFETYEDLFSPRQALALKVFADEVSRLGANPAEMKIPPVLSNAVIAFLGLCVGKLAHSNSMQTWWRTRKGPSKAETAFGQSVLTMVWDFTEISPFGGSVGDWDQIVKTALRGVESLSMTDALGIVLNGPAQEVQSKLPEGKYLVATDPPYFDAIGYADLSDFFYIWHRRALSGLFPNLYSTIGAPRGAELIADKSRHDGNGNVATEFFIDGFRKTFSGLAKVTSPDLPMLIVYAHQHKVIKDGEFGSSGWEALLQALIEANMQITASWPIHCTSTSRLRGHGSNALSTYVLLTCRNKSEVQSTIDRRSFIKLLQSELPELLQAMQSAGVTPLDLAQASIGPGMSVFTRYESILEPDGTFMSVRSALGLIRQCVDEILEDQVSDLDPISRFCLKWFIEYGWNDGQSGAADQLARATNTSITDLSRGGVFEAIAGKARLVRPEEMPPSWDPQLDKAISIWEVTMQIAHAVSEIGIDQASNLLSKSSTRVDVQSVKELSYLLYSIAEKRGWMDSAILFNGLGTSWSSLKLSGTGDLQPKSTQESLSFDLETDSEKED